jgi:hypothetical protein
MFELRDGIAQTASALQMNPLDLATIISYETGGTFNPSQPGPTTQWGQHRGLIQFGEPQAQQYGVDWNNPAGSQLGPDGAIVRYFQQNGWQPGMGLLDAYSIVNAGGPGRYGASDANNGGAPGTVADKVNEQMGGHRANAERLFNGILAASGGTDTMTGGAGGDRMAGLLAPQEPARRPSIWDRLEGVPVLGGLADPDRRARLAIALDGMTVSPDPAFVAMQLQGIDQRAQERETMQRMNQTIAYLQSVGRDDLVALVQAGMDPGQALQTSALPPDAGPEPTSLMQNYDFLIAQGYTPEQALSAVQSGTVVNVGGTEQPMAGPVPAGFARIPDLNNPDNPSGFRDVPIPGGSADLELQAAEAESIAADTKRALSADSTAQTANVVIQDIGRLTQLVSEAPWYSPAVGTGSGLLEGLRGTNAADAKALAGTIRANIGFDRLQQMRESSPTGGALGAVTQNELDSLQAVLGSLDTAQSEDQFLQNLERLNTIYAGVLNKLAAYPNAAEFGITGPQGSIGVTTLPPSGGGTTRMTYDINGNLVSQ